MNIPIDTAGRFPRLTISKFGKFKGDTSIKVREAVAAPQNRQILQTFVWCGGEFVLPTIPTFVKFRSYADRDLP